MVLFLNPFQSAFSQGAPTCTVNAGGNTIVCNAETTLTGSTSGNVSTAAPTWTFISGPTTPTIVSPNTLTTQVTGMTEDGNYTFSLSQPCENGVATSQVTITAHARPATFTAGSDITNVLATIGTVNLTGKIPAGYTGEWRSVNIYSRNRFNSNVSTNSTFSNSTVENPTFSLTKKANHDIDPAYYAILKITSLDKVCSYEDTTVIRFIPNPIIAPTLVYGSCISSNVTSESHFVPFTENSPLFNTVIEGTAANPAFGTTVTLNVVNQPTGGNISLSGIKENSRIVLNGIDVTGIYTFTLTVTNAAGSYTTPSIAYTFNGIAPFPSLFNISSHPDQLTLYSNVGSGGEFHGVSKVGSMTSERFYFDIDSRNPSSTITTVAQTGIIPGGQSVSISVSGENTMNRYATITPPSPLGWQVGTYRFTVTNRSEVGGCASTQTYYIHVSDNNRPNVTVSDVNLCYPGNGTISATIQLPEIYKGVVNPSYYQDYTPHYNFNLISGPAGAATPTYTATNLRSITSSSTTISNFNRAGTYKFSITAVPVNTLTGDFLALEYAASGSSLTSEFEVVIENLINSNAGSDQSITCTNSVSLIGNTTGTGTGTWGIVSAPNGTTPQITNINSPSTTVNGLSEEGIYRFSWQIESELGYCISIDTVQISRTCALPVRLISIDAKPTNENNVLVEWNTAEEINSKGFLIERSSDAKNWQPLQFFDSYNELKLRKYQFTDSNPINGINYYRLKQIDLDDSYAYSTIVSAKIQTEFAINIFPNPTSQVINISGLKGTEELIISNVAGQNLIKTKAKSDRATINIQHLGAGIYFVKVRENNMITNTKKIMISK